MDCPCCDRPMIVVEMDQIELDHCIHCKGSWLDAGELELLLEEASNSDELVSRVTDGVSVTEDPRRCPICDKQMNKITYDLEDGKIVLDACKKNHGLWFDQGELAEILRYGDFPRERDIYKLLKEIFGEESPAT